MRIIKHGYFSKDGIYIECRYCGCNFLVENKYDLKTRILKGFGRNSKVVDYSVVCPECNSEIIIGNESNDYSRSALFSRKDWKERYEVKLEEVKNEV